MSYQCWTQQYSESSPHQHCRYSKSGLCLLVFEHSICITTHKEWLSVELGRVNQEKLEATKATKCNKYVVILAAKPHTADNSPVTYAKATATKYEPYLTLYNPRKCIVNTAWSAEGNTINKLKHDVLKADYAALLSMSMLLSSYTFDQSFLPIFLLSCWRVTTLSSTKPQP